MRNSLRHKIVFITGASSGIGEACAIECAAMGAKLILSARRIDRLEGLAKKLQDDYATEVLVLALDVRKRHLVQESIDTLPEGWQAIDILINNAGLALGLDSLEAMNETHCEDLIDTNIKGVLYLTQMVLPSMRKRKAGHIVNIGSISSHETYAGGILYCATKHAVRAMTLGLRKDLLGEGIRVSLVSPGMVETEFSEVRFAGDQKRAEAVYKDMVPLNAKDIAETIVFCLTRPKHVNVSEVLVLPTDQASSSEIHRKIAS